MVKWTKEKLIEDAKRFSTVGEWRKHSKAAVHAAERKSFYNEIRDMLTPTRKTWDLKTVTEDALKYTSKSVWYENSGSAVQWAKRNKQYANVTAHMDIFHKTWTKETIAAEALKYTSIKEWRKKSNDSYSAANWHKITPEVSKHMKRLNGFWTKEAILAEAIKWSTIKEWREKANGCYITALRLEKDFLKECTKHMEELRESWTVDKITERANKFDNVKDWREQDHSSYKAAIKIPSLYKKLILKMKSLRVPSWTKETVITDALKYSTKVEWKTLNNSGYAFAVKNRMIKTASAHMKPDKTSSYSEREVLQIIKEKYSTATKERFKANQQEKLFKRFELDIFIPELNKGVEFDGTYWHSFENLKRSRKNWTDEQIHNYHEIKDAFFLENGIQVLHIKEQDWKKNKQECLDQIWKFLEN